MKKLLLILAFFLSAASISTAAELSVEVAAIATSVENLIPIGVSEKFPPGAGKLYCYSKITGGEGQSIVHTWYMNEKKFNETVLPIKARSYRTYSYATIYPGMKGKGRVDITTGDGKIIKSVEFLIE